MKLLLGKHVTPLAGWSLHCGPWTTASHHEENLLEMKFSGPHPDLPNHNSRGWGPAVCFHTFPGDSDVSESLSCTVLREETYRCRRVASTCQHPVYPEHQPTGRAERLNASYANASVAVLNINTALVTCALTSGYCPVEWL